MKILAFYPYVPYPLNRGAYYRGYHLLKGLAGDHEVDLLALAEKGEGAEYGEVFKAFCGRVEVVPFEHPPWQKFFPGRLLNPEPATIVHWKLDHVRERVDQLLAETDYEAVHLFDMILGQYFLREHTAVPLVLDRTRVDLYYQWMELARLRPTLKNRLLGVENLAKVWRFEKRMAKRAALEVVCGPDDERWIRQYVSRKVPVAVIPNGVDLSYFHPEAEGAGQRAAEPTIVFCGAMDYNPNIDALRWYFGGIHERIVGEIPQVRVLIVGKSPGPEVEGYSRLPNVTVTGAVPDVRPYYREAWLQIVPLRIGGGTRLKIVESMAMGTAVVSTTIGAQGLNLENDKDILLADERDEFVRAVVRGLRDEELRKRLEKTGGETVAGRLSWPVLGKELSRCYRETLGAERGKREAGRD